MKIDLTAGELNVLSNAMHISIKAMGWESLTPEAMSVKMKLLVAAQTIEKSKKDK